MRPAELHHLFSAALARGGPTVPAPGNHLSPHDPSSAVLSPSPHRPEVQGLWRGELVDWSRGDGGCGRGHANRWGGRSRMRVSSILGRWNPCDGEQGAGWGACGGRLVQLSCSQPRSGWHVSCPTCSLRAVNTAHPPNSWGWESRARGILLLTPPEARLPRCLGPPLFRLCRRQRGQSCWLRHRNSSAAVWA